MFGTVFAYSNRVAERKANTKALERPPQRCPECGSGDLILDGVVASSIRQTVSKGALVSDRKKSRNTVVRWERITCQHCGAQCERTDQRIVQLQQEIEQLQLQLAYITGRLVPENRLPC